MRKIGIKKMVSISINFEDFDKDDYKFPAVLSGIIISALLVFYTLWSSFPSLFTYTIFSVAALLSPLPIFYFYIKRPDSFDRDKFRFSVALFVILLFGSYHVAMAQNAVPERQINFDFGKENLTVEETSVEITQGINHLTGNIEIDVANEPGRIEFDENDCLDLRNIEDGEYIGKGGHNESIIKLTGDDLRINISCQSSFDEYHINPAEGRSELDLAYPQIEFVDYNLPYGPMIMESRDAQNWEGADLEIDLRHQEISIESEQNDDDLSLKTYPKYSLYNKLLSLFSLLLVGLSVTLIEGFFDNY